MNRIVKLSFLLMCSIAIFSGCGSKEERFSLVCKGKAKSCVYKAVEASTIGEEEYLCDEEYGDVVATFNYEESKKWNTLTFVTTYFEDKSTEETYNELLSKCIDNCGVEMIDDKIVYTEYYRDGEYQNGKSESIKRYMSNLGYDCE